MVDRKFDEVLVMTTERRYYNNNSCNKEDETNSWVCKVREYEEEKKDIYNHYEKEKNDNFCF